MADLRILHIEDMPSDAYLVQRELKKILGPCTFQCVETKAEFLQSLIEFKPGLILSDYTVPGFDWHTAFKLMQENSPGIPFIIVTGSESPAIASECIKAGALDFISKSQLDKLGAVILKVFPPHKEGQ